MRGVPSSTARSTFGTAGSVPGYVVRYAAQSPLGGGGNGTGGPEGRRGSVHQSGHPMSASTNTGFRTRPSKVPLPSRAAACVREGLTRDAASDAIHDATPRSSIEGGEVAPDRSRIQPPLAHARDQTRDCEGFPFDVTDRARLAACSSESFCEAEVEPSDAGADGEDVGRYSHTLLPLPDRSACHSSAVLVLRRGAGQKIHVAL